LPPARSWDRRNPVATLAAHPDAELVELGKQFEALDTLYWAAREKQRDAVRFNCEVVNPNTYPARHS
jgi:hypothetical protein